MLFSAVWHWVQLWPDLEKFERPLLHRGRRGKHVEDLLAHAHSITGERRQVRQQAAKALHRQAIGGLLGGGFLSRGLGALCGSDNAGSLGLRCLLVFIIE